MSMNVGKWIEGCEKLKGQDHYADWRFTMQTGFLGAGLAECFSMNFFPGGDDQKDEKTLRCLEDGRACARAMHLQESEYAHYLEGLTAAQKKKRRECYTMQC